jgi:hypothetical protein
MLIAVVIFVLVITMVGLSIFSLGSYEAGFVARDHARARALLAAQSGLVRARAILEATGSKALVTNSANPGWIPGVVAMVARQGGDSTGNVDWTDPNNWVELEATAVVGNSRRTLRRYFRPQNLLGQHENLIVNRGALGVYQPGTVSLTGNVLQSSGDMTWRSQVGGSSNVTVTAIQAPDLDAFIDAHRAGAITISPDGEEDYEMNDAGSNNGFYYFPPQTGDWSLTEIPGDYQPDFEVDGTVVMMVEGGIDFPDQLEIKHRGDTPEDDRLLLIVTGRDLGPNNRVAMRIRDRIQTCNIPVIIITDGRVEIGEEGDLYSVSGIDKLALCADGVMLNKISLSYNSALLNDFFQDLAARDDLPIFKYGAKGLLAPLPTGWASLENSTN